MTEVLVSDLGKVILPFDFAPTKDFLRQRSRRASNGIEVIDPWAVLSELHEELAFGTGGCESQEFFRRVSDGLDLDCTFDEFCRAWSDVFQEDHAVVEVIRQAKVRHRYLLSNTNAIHWEWILANHGEILKVFDRLIASQDIGALKPDPEIYRRVADLSGFPPASHLLIDDIADNVEGARACGWDGIVFRNASQLERELQERELL